MKNRRGKPHKKNTKNEDNVYIELDTKCSCPQLSVSSDHASIQFTRRYLECQGSMPIRILRSYIEKVLPHSPMTQVSIYDSNDQILDDTIRLKDLSLSSSYIPLRFTMMNTVTSFGHCLCSSPSSPVKSCSSFSPTIIRRETINRTLSTCPLVPTPPHSPSSSTSISPIVSKSSMPIVNLLTPPSPPHYSSFLIDNIVESNCNDQSIIDKITSEFGEICPSLPSVKAKRQRIFKKMSPKSLSSDIPLDLSVKKRPSSFDLFSTQSKWLKMI
ncbi:unnamed protein product [Rotaria socialis]|uniref:Uncharacterized protein n=1 Tax=Rotaria socialis TaxID=392032 RepID=A0A820D1M7_9BILA|nr:unnamed protein product [Rotaria socialis]CAF3343298.1 unnamed protein product [Rotaria socialis]CAF3419823.1 unnamed protein product [Rotaria socialis]CAF3702513.1 unnamed protein product [Rotaria socialis]CAF3795189.1 unnamed protein product [Rotaria socialis]